MGPTQAQGSRMKEIAPLVVMNIDSTSETWSRLVNDTSGHPTVLYRSEFHAALTEISRTCHMGPVPPVGYMRVMCLCTLWKLVRWIKTEVNTSAVKHIVSRRKSFCAAPTGYYF